MFTVSMTFEFYVTSLVAHHINFPLTEWEHCLFKGSGNGTGQIIIYEILPVGVEISKK